MDKTKKFLAQNIPNLATSSLMVNFSTMPISSMRIDGISAEHFACRIGDGLQELGLTPKELEVLKLLLKGMEDKEISNMLQISNKTVGHHVSSIICKLGARNRTHAVVSVFNLIVFT